MRILVASDQWHPDFAGGSARVATEVARRLARRGHQIDAVVPEGAGDPAPEDGLRVLRTIRRGRLPRTLADTLGAATAGRSLAGRYEALLAHQATTAVGAAHARPGVPLALVFHASARRELDFQRTQLPHGPARLASLALGPALGLLERRALAAARSVLVLSEFSRSLVLEDDPGAAARIRLVSGGVDVEAFTPGYETARTRLGIPDGTVQLLTVRRLDARMGLEALIDAFASIRKPGLHLAIAGTGPLEASLRSRVGQLALGSSVTMLGRVSETALTDWYRAADLFVLPTVAYEGFGLVTVEALACGTPVVGTPIGATPELLRPLSPDLVTAGSSAPELAAAINRTLPSLGPGLRERCRRHACARYGWEAVTDLWESALRETATGRPEASTIGAMSRDLPAATRR